MISLILISIAAIFNSIMDTLFDHFNVSIFKNLNPNLWNPMISWKTSKTILGYHVDAWHIFKSIMIILLILSIICYKQLINPYLDFLIFGISWNIIFNIFLIKY